MELVVPRFLSLEKQSASAVHAFVRPMNGSPGGQLWQWLRGVPILSNTLPRNTAQRLQLEIGLSSS